MRLLEQLDETKATGPDHIPAAILKRICKQIAAPFTVLCRRLLQEACWPRIWRLHVICPLYKRGSAFTAGNYRGVHLTAILAKTAERLICRDLIKHLHTGKFGPDQWAFTPGLSARDLVTASFLFWILAICTGNKIAAYLGDISGAFDRVYKDYLLAKLQAAGVGACFLNFLDSYLQPRKATVAVEGVTSEEFEIANTVFQGTVLGPPLWIVFFSDVTQPASSTGGNPPLFADDLSVFQKFDRFAKNSEIIRAMHVCRNRVHAWGRVNRVAFDPTKEHVVILHPIRGEGDPFKLLGCLVDCKLVMDQAIDKILSQVRPKRQSILRTKPHYCVTDLINQFKSHVWSLMEYHSGAIFHASDSLLERLDSAQRGFLQEIDVSPELAFLEHNVAPPKLRRNIGMLGFLHKRVLGKSHPAIQRLFPFHADVFGSLRPGEHDKQLYDHILEVQQQQSLHRRSVFGMVQIYNRLPQHVVNHTTISLFQRHLTLEARKLCEDGNPTWIDSFSCRL